MSNPSEKRNDTFIFTYYRGSQTESILASLTRHGAYVVAVLRLQVAGEWGVVYQNDIELDMEVWT
jgi:hypothetical protein